MPYNHQINELVEHFNAALRAVISKYIHACANNCDIALQPLLFA